MEERVVNVPLAGGINQDDDVFSVQPPEMLELVNVQSVVKGAFDSRPGFELVTRTTDKRPALTFTTPGGALQTLPNDIETISSNSSASGTRAVLAAGGKFYDWVGGQSDRGWREVNDLPEHVGTLVSTASTGGSIIEIDSLIYDNDTKRITFWVTGKRTGQELSSDRMMLDQENGDGNSVYYSVQVVGTDAYIVPPTRLKNTAGAYTQSAQNLRVILLDTRGSAASARWPMAFWYNRATDQIEYVVISPDTGAIVGTVTQNLTRISAFTLVKTHRNFDVCALPPSLNAQVPTIAYVYCEDDTVGTGPAAIEAVLAYVDPTTAAVNATTSVPDILHRTAPLVAPAFRPYANRGIVLNQRPFVSETVVPPLLLNWTSFISYSARVIARYWADAEGPVETDKLDCQLVSGRLEGAYNDGTTTWTLDWSGGQYIPLIGFQTNDNLTNVLATVSAPDRVSASPNTRSALETTVYAYTGTPPVSVFSSPGWPAEGYVSFGNTSANSEWTMAIRLVDGSDQTYFADIAATSAFAPALGTTPAFLTLRPRASRPYAEQNATGLDAYDNRFKSVAQGFTVGPSRLYPGNLPIDWSTLPQADRQVQLLDIDAAGVNTGFTPGTHTGCDVIIGGNVIATATVFVDAAGAIVACAIENPLAGPGPGYAFAGVVNTAWSAVVASIAGGTPGIGAGTLTGAQVWNLTHGVATIPEGSDVPDAVSRPANTSFYYVGQQEHCVHRWAIAQEDEKNHIIALSSCSATTLTNPQGDTPFGAASPHQLNNFLEVYGYSEQSSKYYDPLVPFLTGTSTALKCALGGPWRLLSDIYRAADGRCYMAATTAGDGSQASTFLLRFRQTQEASISWPGGNPDLEAQPYPSANGTLYANNAGMFVEAANMMRVTAPTLNVPTLQYTSAGFTLGALRNASSKGLQECFAIDYEYLPQNWRQMVRMSDYTFINGGILSVFDGVNCNEHGMLVWPQRDLTSVSWGDGGAQRFALANDNVRPFKALTIFGGPGLAPTAYLLNNITRPFFLYESGMRVSNNTPYDFDFGAEQTRWGGDPSQNFEAVYADLRVQQFNDATKTSTNGGSSLYGSHYYGRYQNTGSGFSPDAANLPPKYGNSAYFLWAPRAAAGWSNPNDSTSGGNRQSNYTQAEAGGNFLLSWCYEYADGTGRAVRSAPSSPIQYTINAEILASDPTASEKRGAIRAGGLVTKYKWGFFVPRLELTNRLSAASEDPRRVTLQPYSTCEPYSTVLYRMPWQNFLNPINDFVVPRNASRGVVPYASRPFDAASVGLGQIDQNPCGLVVCNIHKVPVPPAYAGAHNGIFDGPTGDYNGMLREPYLYTTGGVLDNVAPPGCKAMCVHQNRLVIGGADDATVVWFTKELSPTDAPGFNDTLTLTIEAGGAVTGLASMNSNLFIFKENDIYVVAGTMPDATGQSSSLSEPTRLPHGIGCTDPRSVIATPIGIFFRSGRSIEILTPDLQVRSIGDKIRDILQPYPYVVSTSHNPQSEEVYFVLQGAPTTRVSNAVQSTVVVYSYLSNTWYRWNLPQDLNGTGSVSQNSTASMTVINNAPWFALGYIPAWAGGGTVYQQGSSYVDGLENNAPTYAFRYPVVSWVTAPFALNEVQGFQRVKRARLLARPIAGTAYPPIAFLVQTDPSALQNVLFTQQELGSIAAIQGGVLQLETHLSYQKGQFMQLGAQTSAPSVVDQNVMGYRFSNIALVVGLKTGLNKRITEQAKH
jgi:hypothetical protein